MLKSSQCFFLKKWFCCFYYSYCCLQMNYLCIWFHFFSAAGLILDIIFLHSRKLWLCLDFPAFPFSMELAGFIKKVRNKNKTSLSGLSVNEIVQRVTQHILDEERKKKVSVSFKFILRPKKCSTWNYFFCTRNTTITACPENTTKVFTLVERLTCHDWEVFWPWSQPAWLWLVTGCVTLGKLPDHALFIV